jgi:hypothetical protein
MTTMMMIVMVQTTMSTNMKIMITAAAFSSMVDRQF